MGLDESLSIAAAIQQEEFNFLDPVPRQKIRGRVSCNLQFPLLGVIGVIAGVGGGGRVQGCRGQSDAMQWEGRSEGDEA